MRMPRYASADACADLAAWWGGAGGVWLRGLRDRAPGPFARVLNSSERERDMVTFLAGAGSLESRPWSSESRPVSRDTGESVVLAAYLAGRFADHAGAWEVYPAIAARFCGSVGELVDAVLAASAPAAQRPA
jgi:hypothetical protein